MELKHECEFDYEERDINLSDDWTERYGLMIPVVEIDGKEVQYGQVKKNSYMKRLQKNNGYLLLEIVKHPCYYNGAGEIFFEASGT